MISLDTNILTASATGDKDSEECIKEYLSKESNDGAFLTPKVVEEAFDIGSKLTHQLFLIKKRMVQKDLSFKEAEEDIMEDFDNQIDGALKSVFGNFTSYISENAEDIEDVEKLEREIDRELSRFQHKNRKIRPPKKAIKEDKQDYKAKKEELKEGNLVHSKDLPIVMQLWRYNTLDNRDVELITNDDGDFRNSEDSWNDKISFLDVKKPKEYLS